MASMVQSGSSFVLTWSNNIATETAFHLPFNDPAIKNSLGAFLSGYTYNALPAPLGTDWGVVRIDAFTLRVAVAAGGPYWVTNDLGSWITVPNGIPANTQSATAAGVVMTFAGDTSGETDLTSPSDVTKSVTVAGYQLAPVTRTIT